MAHEMLQCSFKKCKKWFPSALSLNRHAIVHVQKQKAFGCCACHVKFETMIAAAEHFEDKHIEEKNYTQHLSGHSNRRESQLSCTGCNQYKEVRAQCKDDYEDSKRRSFACKICGELFEVQSVVILHMDIAHRQCGYCDKWFEFESQLYSHFGEVHFPHFQCSICLKRIYNTLEIQEHVDKVHLNLR